MRLLEGRSASGRQWYLAGSDPELALLMARQLDIPMTLAGLLVSRGIGLDQAQHFLNPTFKENLPDPISLRGLNELATILCQWIHEGRVIGLIGDYDVDGATSTALMGRYLRAAGVEFTYYIPDRFLDGYGPSSGAWDFFEARQISHLVTMDCGATAFEALDEAHRRGLQVAVIDHHQMGEQEPISVSLVNPNHPADKSGCGQLCAAGVTFLVLVRLHRLLVDAGHYEGKKPPDLRMLTPLAALGAVCDVVPLVGVNRLLTRHGLMQMAEHQLPGVTALMKSAGLTSANTASDLGFRLGPRLNAGGRLGQSPVATKLLLSDDDTQAEKLALELELLNEQRRKIEAEMRKKAEELAKDTDPNSMLLLIADEGFHEGVMGIVASRLKDAHQKPALVCAASYDGWKGSGRSLPGFDLGAAVIAAREQGLLTKGGGHAMAAGFSCPKDGLAALQAFLHKWFVQHARPEDPKLTIDARLDLDDLSVGFWELLQQAGPFGPGNLEPIFLLEHVHLEDVAVLKEKHLRLSVKSSARGKWVKIMGFNMAEEEAGHLILNGLRNCHMAVRVVMNEWQGRKSAELHLVDVACP